MTTTQDFYRGWISGILEELATHLDEFTRIRLMEECGRRCARREAKQKADACIGNLPGWLEQFKKWVGNRNVQKKGKTIRIQYSKCFCPIGKELKPSPSSTLCLCSQGWLKEIFETVSQSGVSVSCEETILRGGKTCCFTLTLESETSNREAAAGISRKLT